MAAEHNGAMGTVVAGSDGPPPRARAEIERIVSVLQARRAALAGEAVAAIQAAIPAYAARTEPAFVEDLTIHVESHYERLLETVGSGRVVTSEEMAFLRAPATRRARAGVPLADFLHAFRVGHQVLWDAILAEAEHGGEPAREAALSLVRPVMTYIDLVSTQAGEVYLEMQQRLLADSDRIRRDVLERLLAGTMPAAGRASAVAHEMGLEADAAALVVAAIAVKPLEDPDALQTAAAALARGAAAGLSALVVVRQTEIVAVAALPDSDPLPVCERIEAAQRRSAREGVALAIGVSTVAHGVAELPRAYREACDALELVPAEGGTAALPTLSLFDYLNASADPTARRLVDERTRSFLEEDREKGGVLIETLRAYVASDLNVRRAAERLFVHPNTAHYRLNRIAERTGRDIRSITDVIELLVAVSVESDHPGALAGGSSAAASRRPPAG